MVLLANLARFLHQTTTKQIGFSAHFFRNACQPETPVTFCTKPPLNTLVFPRILPTLLT
jgi:hypothetical protein